MAYVREYARELADRFANQRLLQTPPDIRSERELALIIAALRYYSKAPLKLFHEPQEE